MIDIKPLGDIKECRYDIFMCALGYEKRCRQLFELNNIDAQRKIAFSFEDFKVFSYQENYNFFNKTDFTILESDCETFSQKFEDAVEQELNKNELTVCVDISSFNRKRLASVIWGIHKLSYKAPIKVDFCYSPSKYVPSSQKKEKILNICPVEAPYNDLSSGELPVSLIIGTGYEKEKALGIYEYLEASKIKIFYPIKGIGGYDNDMMDANQTLFYDLHPDNLIPYSLRKPFEVFCNLASVVRGLSFESRPVIVPMGPKPFYLASLLLSVSTKNKVQVLRCPSVKDQSLLYDCESDGKVVGISTYFQSHL